MSGPTTTLLRIGDWCVDPSSGQISRNGETARLEVRSMRLLLCLAEHAGEVVSIDDLLTQVWTGVNVSPDSVYQGITSLRRLLGDDSKQPTYIATVPRLGYRLVAPVSPWSNDFLASENAPANSSGSSNGPEPVVTAERLRVSTGRKLAAAGALCLALIAGFLLYARVPGKTAKRNSSPPSAGTAHSIAVLPFLDLTDQMNEEPFADGMTEELIDRLSKIPGLRVPAPTSSFYFKGKKIPVGEIARILGVGYVLDGSVRKSGARLRVAARLIRADNGYIVWSETYDRPVDDILMVQDDIAGEVTKALRTSIAE